MFYCITHLTWRPLSSLSMWSYVVIFRIGFQLTVEYHRHKDLHVIHIHLQRHPVVGRQGKENTACFGKILLLRDIYIFNLSCTVRLYMCPT